MHRLLLGIWLMVITSLVVSGCAVLDYKARAGLQVITGDISSSLFLDGQYLEKTPYIGKDIKPGTYSLKIQPDDPTLVAHEVNITLRQGLLTVVTWQPGTRPELSGGVIYEMEKLPGRGQTELAVVSIPDGAIVSFPGREKEFAPLTISEVEPGQREFEVALPSYESQRHTINIVEGHRTTITVKLAKADTVEVESSVSTSASSAAVEISPPPGGSQRAASISAQTLGISTTSGRRSGLTVSGTKITIQPTGYFENDVEVVKVRDAASSNGDVIGTAPVGTEYPYLNELFDGWYKIQFGTQIGWVSAHYAKLSD